MHSDDCGKSCHGNQEWGKVGFLNITQWGLIGGKRQRALMEQDQMAGESSQFESTRTSTLVGGVGFVTPFET